MNNSIVAEGLDGALSLAQSRSSVLFQSMAFCCSRLCLCRVTAKLVV
jgi:hypothetical protein